MRAGFRRRAAFSVLIAMCLAVTLQVASADGPDAIAGGLGGDYPSFYAAGSVVLDDVGLDAEELYDPQTQFAAQAPVLPVDEDGNLYFAYPAFFVGLFVPLAALDFEWSYLLNVVLMTAALAAAIVLLRPVNETVRRFPLEVGAVAVSFFPLFRGITGGQNTALSLLLIAVIWRALYEDHELAAGAAAALLLFKPPLALPFLGALLLGRRLRALAAAAGTTGLLYAVGALLTDPSWPVAWVDAVRYLDRVDTPFNVHNFVSAPGVAEALLGTDSFPATIAGLGVALVATVLVSWTWWSATGDLDVRIALTAAGAILISPHALYYDAGLLLVVGLVLADRRPDLKIWLIVGWAAGFSHLLAEPLGWSPVVLLVFAAFGGAAALLRPRPGGSRGRAEAQTSVTSTSSADDAAPQGGFRC